MFNWLICLAKRRAAPGDSGFPQGSGIERLWRTPGHPAGLMGTSQACRWNQQDPYNFCRRATIPKREIGLWLSSWFNRGLKLQKPVKITYPLAQVCPPCHFSSFLSLSLSTGLVAALQGPSTSEVAPWLAPLLPPCCWVLRWYSSRLPPGLARKDCSMSAAESFKFKAAF